MGAGAEAQKIAIAVRHRRNAEKVKECQSSGKSIAVWCKQEGISTSTYYRWLRQTREEFLDSDEGQKMAAQLLPGPDKATKMLPGPRFSELPAFPAEPASIGAAIRIQIGGAVVEIQKETDARLAESVVRALAKQC